MAHFAELDINNKVIRVLTACNIDVQNNGGDQSEQAALHFGSLNKFTENGVKWVQTSYNNNFRKKYAGIEDTFDFVKNKFITPQPFASWSLDANDDWQPPIAYPTVTTYGASYINENGVEVSAHYRINWDEIEKKWFARDSQNNQFVWIPSSFSWISTGI